MTPSFHRSAITALIASTFIFASPNPASAQTSEGPFHQQDSGHAGRDSSDSPDSANADSGSADEGNTQDTYVPLSKRHFLASTGHGLFFGRGRPTDNGFHAQDSVSASIRQFHDGSRFTETAEADANTVLGKGSLQGAEGSLALQYRLGGFTASAGLGGEYSTILFNTITRAQKVKTTPSFDRHFTADAYQHLIFDADSTWDLKLDAGYDDLGGIFKTTDASAKLDKTLGDFDLYASAGGFFEKADNTSTDCVGKGKGKTCTDSTIQTSLAGYDISGEADWDLDPHEMEAKVGLDWQHGTRWDRIVSIGAGYAYSATKWLDLGASVYREVDLDYVKVAGVKGSARFWLVGVSLAAEM